MFLRALAARSAQLLNLTDLGRDLGLATNTVKAWVSVLEASHQIVILRPYFANVTKRLVKTPKAYFTDSGILCHLIGLKDAAHAAVGPMTGAIAETVVVSEILKSSWHRGEEPRISLWRTATGEEVDVLVETAKGLLPVEAKASATPTPAMAKVIQRFRDRVFNVRQDGYVLHTDDIVLPLGQGVTALPFSLL